MNKYKSDFFGEIDFEKIKEYYEGKFFYENRKIELDLNMNRRALPTYEQLLKIDDFINNIKDFEKEARQFIDSDFKNGGIAKAYLEYYIEEFETYKLDSLIDKTNKEVSSEKQLLSKIYIQRIGFYPNDNVFAIFDFHVNHTISDQILVVIMENDTGYGITWES